MPSSENPSCLQTTLASLSSHPSSQTVPQVLPRQTSTRPSLPTSPLASLSPPSGQSGGHWSINDCFSLYSGSTGHRLIFFKCSPAKKGSWLPLWVGIHSLHSLPLSACDSASSTQRRHTLVPHSFMLTGCSQLWSDSSSREAPPVQPHSTCDLYGIATVHASMYVYAALPYGEFPIVLYSPLTQ